ncbi:MAG: diguanylate cyclase [Polyangiales bacterium]
MSDLPRYWTSEFTEVYLKAMNANPAFQKAAAKMDETIVLRCLDDPDGLDKVVAYRVWNGRIEVVDEREGKAPSAIRNEAFDGSRFLARTTAPYAFWKRLDAKEIGVLHVITSPECTASRAQAEGAALPEGLHARKATSPAISPAVLTSGGAAGVPRTRQVVPLPPTTSPSYDRFARMGDWDDDEEDGNREAGMAGHLVAARRNRRAYVIVIVGPDVGETHELAGGTSEVGRTSATPIHLMDPEGLPPPRAFSWCRVSAWSSRNLGSTNGTFVERHPRSGPTELADGDKIQIGTTTILKFSFHDALDRAFQQKMYDAALRDGLTGAFNKRHFKERLESELAYAVRHRTPLALILFDLDHFKRLNDQFGHLAGDHVLETLAKGVLRAMRKEDFFARWGGEEFAVLSRGIDLEGGRRFGERLRAWVEGNAFLHEGKRMPVTASIGVAALPQCDVTDPDVFVQCADEALYAAKHGGRNRVVTYGGG